MLLAPFFHDKKFNMRDNISVLTVAIIASCCFHVCSLTKPHVAVVGAGFGGWGAAKALCENGCRVTLLDVIPDPTGATPYLTPTGVYYLNSISYLSYCSDKRDHLFVATCCVYSEKNVNSNVDNRKTIRSRNKRFLDGLSQHKQPTEGTIT